MDLRFISLIIVTTLLLAGCTQQGTGVGSVAPAPSGSAQNAAPASAQSSTSASVGASGASNANFLTYDGGAYQIRYPGDWSVREEGSVVLFQSPASSETDVQENVNVIVVPTDQELEAFVEAALGATVESSGFELIDSTETTLSGKPARKIIYSEQSAETKTQTLQVISVSDGTAAIVTYTATPETFADFKTEAETMISSFQLKTEAVTSAQTNPVESSMAPEIVRKWRVYSEAIFYDAGGNNFLETPVTTLLDIRADQTWSFGSSTGTWSVQAIQESDWDRWGVPSYGPTRKLVLNGWNSDTNDGPIEESGDRVDFMWVIYRVGPPAVQSAGQIQMKFGWTNQQG